MQVDQIGAQTAHATGNPLRKPAWVEGALRAAVEQCGACIQCATQGIEQPPYVAAWTQNVGIIVVLDVHEHA
jgi:hypothetical protein